jgi:hypothetical protein
LGGVILGGRGNSARGIPTPRNQQHDLPQRVEYRVAKEVLSLVFSLLFPFFLFSLSFFRCKEEDGKAMTDYARRHKGAQGQPFVPISLRCYSRGGKATVPLQNAVKGCIRLHTSPTPCISRSLQRGI